MSDPGRVSAPTDLTAELSDVTSRPEHVSLATIASEWGRIGCVGFGGPPTHIALLRRLCVVERSWLREQEFEDGIAATSLLPGPASTQLAIYCAWRLRGAAGALVGGLCFIVPGLIIILAFAALFLAAHPPLWIEGASAGAGAAVPAVALSAAFALVPASRGRAGVTRVGLVRWACYLAAGALAAATVGPWLVVMLVACGLAEVTARLRRHAVAVTPIVAFAGLPGLSGIAALAWVAFKVGALSYGGGFVIIPLMQHDAVQTYGWMTDAQFLNAVALGQITPGPVVQTVAVVGYAAGGIGGGLLAAAVAFAPSFAFVLAGGRHLGRLRRSPTAQAFLTGAGAAAIGGIAGAAVPLALALGHAWQFGVVAGAAALLFGLRRGPVITILVAAVAGVIAASAGAPVG